MGAPVMHPARHAAAPALTMTARVHASARMIPPPVRILHRPRTRRTHEIRSTPKGDAASACLLSVALSLLVLTAPDFGRRRLGVVGRTGHVGRASPPQMETRLTPTSAIVMVGDPRTKTTHIFTYTCLPDTLHPPAQE